MGPIGTLDGCMDGWMDGWLDGLDGLDGARVGLGGPVDSSKKVLET